MQDEFGVVRGLLLLVCLLTTNISMVALTVSEDVLTKALSGREGVFVLVDAATGDVFASDVKAASEKLAPCSTFKIWNALIGLETGVVSDPDALFWKWDGKKRFLEDWNKDQSLRTAISTSCVPAFQALARKIGAGQMQKWLDALGYGDRDISAGIDVFWLPHPPERKTLLISPMEQAQLLAQLIEGRLPVSARTREILSDITTLKTASGEIFHGKTGTGVDETGAYNMGWFVGWVESSGKNLAFACLLKGHGVMGKDARSVVESVLSGSGLLPAP